MPELPEVETTLRGISPHILSQKIKSVVIRHRGLRWPIVKNLETTLKHLTFNQATRRAKYLLLTTKQGTLIIHLGMSGSLRIINQNTPAKKHDHVDIVFANQKVLRFTDPRRFGTVLWTDKNPHAHKLLKELGPEPFDKLFSGNYLWQCAQGKKIAVKSFLMDNKIVVGVGNIYATESLFNAMIHPQKPAEQVTLNQYKKLATEVKKILQKAIKQGGTTLKDFVKSDGKPGYFYLQLKTYGREGLPCVRCKTILQGVRLGQRATVFCGKCQT